MAKNRHERTQARPTKRAGKATSEGAAKGLMARIAGAIQPTTAAACTIALAAGILVGHIATPARIAGITNVGATSVASDQTSEVIATYVYDGKTHSISIADLVDAGYATTNEDGTIAVPSAANILAYAQSQVTKAVATSRDIEVTDDDLDQLISDTYGLDGVAALAEATNATEDQVRSWLTDTALAQKLYATVAGDLPEAPQPVDALEDGAEDVPTESYGTYVLDVLGDDYNVSTQTFANPDSELALAFADQDLSTLADGEATYALASVAYNYQYQRYSAAQSAATEAWNAYMDEVYKDCSITIATLM